MKRLSNRAFQLVKDEVDRHYANESSSPVSQTQNIEHAILLARLKTLNKHSGESLTSTQLWEEVCDILPEIDKKVLKKAGRYQIEPPLVSTSLALGAASIGAASIGAASIGAAAVILTNPLGGESARQVASFGTSASLAMQTNITGTATKRQTSSHYKSTFETARAFGWQAALKGQNPPHSVEHWGQTAALWQQAIALLGQVPRYDESYAIAQAKKTEYQDYLQQVQTRQLTAQNLTIANAQTPQFSRAPLAKAPAEKSSLRPGTKFSQTLPTRQVQSPQEDFLTTAKGYGWQAALASQNAPHPVKKWADISRLWQLALQNLDKIEAQHPSYTEAQQTKTQYEQNLAAIRQRYRTEQDANQRLESLQAVLVELEGSQLNTNATKRNQMQAIVSRLGTIPANTVAYRQAQQLITLTNEQIQTLPVAPSTQIAISTEENG
ncbi:MAG: hypothetical protein ACFB0D_13005 [Phormidesmis sp.]